MGKGIFSMGVRSDLQNIKNPPLWKWVCTGEYIKFYCLCPLGVLLIIMVVSLNLKLESQKLFSDKTPILLFRFIPYFQSVLFVVGLLNQRYTIFYVGH